MCAEAHAVVTTMTGLNHNTSEKHIEVGSSNTERDFKDMCSIQEWLVTQEPFDLKETKLRSLSSGFSSSDGNGLNCDKTEDVKVKIHKLLDNKTVTGVSIKTSLQVRLLLFATRYKY